jgi:hypothetical protein
MWRCANQNVTAARLGVQKPALSSGATTDPQNLDEIAEGDHFTVITEKANQP